MDKKVMVISGCRPEIIKMFPIIEELRNRDIECVHVHTGQHTDLAMSTMEALGIYPDIEFSAIEHSVGFANSSLSYILDKLDGVIINDISPSVVVVQGDTSTTLAGALFAFHHEIPLVYVESGLRTYKKEPYPEEINRQIIARIADVNCCPTKNAMNNLISENVIGEKYVAGNTEVDAIYYALDNCVPKKCYSVDDGRRTIVVTLHRRESIGMPMRNVCRDIVKVAETTPVDVIVTKHPNPGVSKIIEEELENIDLQLNSTMLVVEPMDFVSFAHQMAKSTLIITDSGGIQESASALGIPVVVARNVTDRPECSSVIAGTNAGNVYTAVMKILKSQELYDEMAKAKCPFGDGHAAEKIVDLILEV